ARPGPWQEPPRHLRNGHAPQRQAQKTQVEHDNHSEKQAHGQNMERLDDGIPPERFVDRDTPGRIRQPFAETLKRHHRSTLYTLTARAVPTRWADARREWPGAGRRRAPL